MIIPVRCFTCGKLLGHLWDIYQEKIQKYYQEQVLPYEKNSLMKGEDLKEETPEKKVLDELGIKRYCCRTVMLTHVDLSEKI